MNGKTNQTWWFILLALIIAAILGIIIPGSKSSPDDPALSAGDTAWMLSATAMVLLMTPGLAFFYGGMIQPKNVISTMMQSFIAMGIVSILWVFIGFSIAFGTSVGWEGYGFFGNPFTYFMFRDVGLSTHPDLESHLPTGIVRNVPA
jgi:ammonium transporter, Amt family